MLDTKIAALENGRPWSSYRVGALEEHLSGLVVLRSSTGLVLLRSQGQCS